jgi:hypothetical protein
VKQNKLHDFYSARELYNSMTATAWWILVPTFANRGVSYGQRSGLPMVIDLRFLYQTCHFFFQGAPHLSSQGWVDPIPGPPLLRKSGKRRESYPEPLSLQRGTLTIDYRGCPRTVKRPLKYTEQAGVVAMLDLYLGGTQFEFSQGTHEPGLFHWFPAPPVTCQILPQSITINYIQIIFHSTTWYYTVSLWLAS